MNLLVLRCILECITDTTDHGERYWGLTLVIEIVADTAERQKVERNQMNLLFLRFIVERTTGAEGLSQPGRKSK